jgi:peroxiredoxin
MRPILLVIPSVLALASAAGFYAFALHQTRPESTIPADEWKHPVTSEMTAKAELMHTKPAPTFTVKDVAGATIEIGGPHMKRPQFVYFVNNDCPCSYAAEPLFHALAAQFKGQIDFISVTDGTPDQAKHWVSEMQVEYPLIADPKVEIMKAYHATSSAYSALVTKDGRIEKLWPGFSKDLLLDMNSEMAKTLGQPERPFDTQYAPIKPATGCSF